MVSFISITFNPFDDNIRSTLNTSITQSYIVILTFRVHYKILNQFLNKGLNEGWVKKMHNPYAILKT
jgi:hypothetical protein